MNLSIRAKLVLAIGAPLLVVYGVMSGVEYERASRLAVARTRARLGELTRSYAAVLDARLTLGTEVVRSTADFLTLQPTMGAVDIRRVLEANVRRHPHMFASGVFFEPEAFQAGLRLFGPYVHRRADGGELAYLDFTGGTGYDYTQSAWYVTPKQNNQASWSEPYFDTGAGNIVMCTHSAPFHRNGKFRGVVTVDLSLEEVRKELAHVDIEGGGYCALASSSGRFISHPEASWVMKETVFSVAEKLHQPQWAEIGRDIVAGRSGVRRTVNQQGEPTYMVLAPVRSAGWSLVACVPVASVMAPAVADLHRNLCVLAAGLALILVIVLVVSVRITRPIALLAAGAEKLGKGDLDVRVTGITNRDEIGNLATTFNSMVVQLKESVEARVREESARRTVENELRVARRIQAEMMPHAFPAFPDRTEFDLHALNEPAAYVAGDFYDFFFVTEQVLALVIADVSGKGMPAALLMAMARMAIRNFAVLGQTPGAILKHLNDMLAGENPDCMFVTVFCAHYDVRTGELRFANAGHLPPYILRRDGRVETLDETDPLAGVFANAAYREHTASLEPGEVLVAFTDGVTEAHTGAGELFGEQRFEDLLRRVAAEPVEKINRTVLRAVLDWSKQALADDVTLLSLRRNR